MSKQRIMEKTALEITNLKAEIAALEDTYDRCWNEEAKRDLMKQIRRLKRKEIKRVKKLAEINQPELKGGS